MRLLTSLTQGGLEIYARFLVTGPELEGLPVLIDSLAYFALASEENAEVIVRFGEVRLEMDGLLEVLGRLGELVSAKQNTAHIIQSNCGLWVN